ncbi:hypothetical protein MPSI1_002755 [Malassezia psittaci]|uniref:Bromodomain associated domain-containing protein n=1 Tax=Malassezia psittaci TaxID=1821823 RepID=A0AAF0FAX6_9BASI|nr:hypothetical protein MPSI1_002755 [Malassezia psittaci]
MGTEAGPWLRCGPYKLRPASDFAASQLQTIVPMILHTAGFHGGSSNACLVLAELVQRYLELLARTTMECANDANRQEATLWDACMGLEHVMGHESTRELSEWADEEEIWKRDLTGIFPEPVLQQRERLAQYLLKPPAKQATDLLEFVPLSDSVHAHLAIRRAKEEAEEDAWIWGEEDEQAPESCNLSQNAPFADRVVEKELPYIPSYLPALPDWDALAQAAAAEHEPSSDSEDMDVSKGEMDASSPQQPTARPPPPPVLPAPGAAELDVDGIRQIWRRRAPAYTGSLSEGAEPTVQFASIHDAFRMAGESEENQKNSTNSKRSSLEAFVHATKELEDDKAANLPVYLTSLTHSHHVNPNSSAFIDGAVKRRRLAHCFADPQRYVPNDSMYGCVYVHPPSPSWVPGPSLLITIPSAQGMMEDSTHATPVFMPIHPHGRPVAMAPPSGSLYPSLAYRSPAQLYTGVRMVATPSLQRVFTRSGDPPALLDDHYTERVFHGMAVSRTLMTGTMMSVQHRHSLSGMINRYRGGNSVLHPALERLRFSLAAQLAAQRRQMRAEEHADDIEEEPIRGEKIKMPIAGTMVYSWDWPTALAWATPENEADDRKPSATAPSPAPAPAPAPAPTT